MTPCRSALKTPVYSTVTFIQKLHSNEAREKRDNCKDVIFNFRKYFRTDDFILIVSSSLAGEAPDNIWGSDTEEELALPCTPEGTV